MTKQIKVNKDFTLQVNSLDLKSYKANKLYEVEDDVANHWYTRAHAEVLGEPATPPVADEPIPAEEAIKKPVPHTKIQKPLDMAPVSKKSKEEPEAKEAAE